MSDTTLTALLDRERLPLLYRTARNMKPRQLAGIADRKLRHLVVPALPIDFDARYESVSGPLSVMSEPLRTNTAALRNALSPSVRDGYRKAARELCDGEVTFRNRTVTVESPSGVEWVGNGVPAPSTLWGLQLHGLSFLLWPVLGYQTPADCPAVVATVTRWLREWDESASNRIGQPGYLRSSWTPHAVSLRLVHLCRYYAWVEGDVDATETARLRRLIVKNARFLANHVEHDVGGNHLIENGAALAMAGLFLPEIGEEWTRQGLTVLETASAQFRADGGHFECSPMYHAVTVTRYVTVGNLLEEAGREVPEALRRVAVEGLRYLRAMEPPDGRLPLLNDSVFGLALSLPSCVAYARAVGIEPAPVRPADASLDSGYYWLGSDDSRLLVDGGAIGPAHLPAHSHNDHFAVLWWAHGDRILADTGVFEYLPTAARQYARSVRAHNTVQYDDVEPIPTGGSYLLGRRIEPTVEYGREGNVRLFDGRYRRETEPRYSHRRQIYATDDWWLVWDTVSAEEAAPVRSRLHLAPGVEPKTVSAEDQRRLVVETDAGDASIVPLEAERITRDERPYYPEFGQSVPRRRITLRADGAEVSFGFLLSTQDPGSVAVRRDGTEITGLQRGETFHPL